MAGRPKLGGLVGADGVLTPFAAGAAVASAFGLMAWSGERFSPAPTHPRMMGWYLSLKKPPFTPPGLAFALGWFTIEGVLGVGGYRLLRKPASPQRNAAVGLGRSTTPSSHRGVRFFLARGR